MADEEHEDHDHEDLHFERADANDETLALLAETNPPLREVLALTRRWGEATPEERQAAPTMQRAAEHFPGWTAGYHSAGDLCASCGKPVTPLFTDVFHEGKLSYGAFISNLPVHATKECLAAFPKKRPDLSPRAVDKARRELTKEMNRPSAGMSQFFRHDVLLHPPFGLDDWANSVSEANPSGLDKGTMKDIERLLRHVHHKLFHAH
jgi:hypothetical protein